jgi:hypothetical protein
VSPRRDAISTARSKESHSTIQYPASTSCVSAYGPSVTTDSPSFDPIRRVSTGAASARVSTSSPDSARSALNFSMNAPIAAKSASVQAGFPVSFPAIPS